MLIKGIVCVCACVYMNRVFRCREMRTRSKGRIIAIITRNALSDCSSNRDRVQKASFISNRSILRARISSPQKIRQAAPIPLHALDFSMIHVRELFLLPSFTPGTASAGPQIERCIIYPESETRVIGRVERSHASSFQKSGKNFRKRGSPGVRSHDRRKRPMDSSNHCLI